MLPAFAGGMSLCRRAGKLSVFGFICHVLAGSFGGVIYPENEHLINEEIRDRDRLIDENGEQKGIVPISQALQAAYDAGLDLVKIAPGGSAGMPYDGLRQV